MRVSKAFLSVLFGLLLVAPALVGAAEPVPVVFAVDASRSLAGADLESVRSAIREELGRLPAGTPLGLVVFADDVEWKVPVGGSATEVAAALDGIEPTGHFTVLFDSLFLVARGLEADGGVVVLFTDGRDENSATTPEDVARLGSEAAVRVVAAAVGHRVDERALRRLVLLTDGNYVGRLAETDTEGLAHAIESSRSEVAAARKEKEKPAPTTAPPVTRPVPIQMPAAPPSGAPDWLVPVLLGIAGLLAVAVILALRRRGPEVAPEAERMFPISPSAPAPKLPPTARGEETRPAILEDALAEAAKQPIAEKAVETELDPSVFQKAPLPAGIERTLVLNEQPRLVVREKSQQPRAYNLPREEVFAVGRAPGINTLRIDDRTLSAQHFKIVPKEGEFHVVDLETTNGTMLNGEKVHVHRLRHGDVIIAGTTEFQFQLSLERLG